MSKLFTGSMRVHCLLVIKFILYCYFSNKKKNNSCGLGISNPTVCVHVCVHGRVALTDLTAAQV